MEIHVAATTPGLKAVGKLGPIDIQVTEEKGTYIDGGGHVREYTAPNLLALTFSVDLQTANANFFDDFALRSGGSLDVRVGFEMPWLDQLEPRILFDLALGNPVDLDLLRFVADVKLSLLDLEFDPMKIFDVEDIIEDKTGIPDEFIPDIDDILELKIEGEVALDVRLTVGYDTTGLNLYRQTGDSSDLLDGLYVLGDGQSTGVFFTVGLTGEAGISPDFGAIEFSANARGGVEGSLGLVMNDVNGDDKVRLNELDHYLAQEGDFFGVFDIRGGVEFFLDAEWEVEIDVGEIEDSWDGSFNFDAGV